MHQPRIATPSTNKPSSIWTKRKSQRRRKRRRTQVLWRPPVPASPLPRVQPSSTHAQWTRSWPCESSMANCPRVKRADVSHSDPCACWCPWHEGLRRRTLTAKGLGRSSVWPHAVQSKGTLNCRDDFSLTRAPKFCWTHPQRSVVIVSIIAHRSRHRKDSQIDSSFLIQSVVVPFRSWLVVWSSAV